MIDFHDVDSMTEEACCGTHACAVLLLIGGSDASDATDQTSSCWTTASAVSESKRLPSALCGSIRDAVAHVVGVGGDVRAGHAVGGQDESHDETVQTQSLGEDKNEDNTDEELRLTSVSADTSITDDTNSDTSGKTSHTTAEASSECGVAGVGGVVVWLLAVNSGAEEHRD